MLAQPRGGDDGVAIIPGKPEESHLLKEITPGEDGKAEMPKKKDPLHAVEIALVTRWIAEGAKDDTPENARQRYDQLGPVSRKELATLVLAVAVVTILTLRSFVPALEPVSKSAVVLTAAVLFFIGLVLFLISLFVNVTASAVVFRQKKRAERVLS